MTSSDESRGDSQPDERPSKRRKTDKNTSADGSEAQDSSEAGSKCVNKTDKDLSSEAANRPDASTTDDETAKTKNDEKEYLTLTEETGDIFEAPRNALIIHACNCEGSWGGGIAKAFKLHYPAAFGEYKSHCDDHGHDLMGTAPLIPPVEDSSKKRHFVGALYTSRRYGRGKDKPAKILDATGPAMMDLLEQVTKWNEEHDEPERVGEVRMCKINSGLFAVPWEETVAVLETLDVSSFTCKTIKVIEREAEK